MSDSMLCHILKWQVIGEWAFAFNDIVYDDDSGEPSNRKIYWRRGNGKIYSKNIFDKVGKQMLWFYLSLVTPMNPPPPLVYISNI
jgi:hypothetical protein